MELKEALKEKLIENTGKVLVDSGGAYGRHYERNQDINFDKTPTVTLDFNFDCHTISVYHFLLENYELNEELQKNFDNYAQLEENKNTHWLELSNQWLQEQSEKDDNFDEISSQWYTYNWDNSLSQDIHGQDFNFDGDTHIICHLHNGCDARWGFLLLR